jgi:hypothetical protein
MITVLRLLVGALFISGLFAGCAQPGQPHPQLSEVDKCLRSGGEWRAGSCEQMSAGGGGGY